MWRNLGTGAKKMPETFRILAGSVYQRMLEAQEHKLDLSIPTRLRDYLSARAALDDTVR